MGKEKANPIFSKGTPIDEWWKMKQECDSRIDYSEKCTHDDPPKRLESPMITSRVGSIDSHQDPLDVFARVFTLYNHAGFSISADALDCIITRAPEASLSSIVITFSFSSLVESGFFCCFFPT